MTDLIICACIALDIAGALPIGRLYYGAWRARVIDDNHSRYQGLPGWTMRSPVEVYESGDRAFAVAGSLLLAFAWPVTVPATLAGLFLHATWRPLVRYMDRTPRRSRVELAARALEEQFADPGITDTGPTRPGGRT